MKPTDAKNTIQRLKERLEHLNESISKIQTSEVVMTKAIVIGTDWELVETKNGKRYRDSLWANTEIWIDPEDMLAVLQKQRSQVVEKIKALKSLTLQNT